MLGGLLCNLWFPHSTGPVEVKPVPASTSWNPRWSEMYGPDAQRLKEDRAAVKRAVKELKEADYVPPELEEAKAIVHSRSLVDELDAFTPEADITLVYVLEAWLFFCDWRKKDDDAIAITLLMMD